MTDVTMVMDETTMFQEILRLKEKCDKQATMLRRLFPDKYDGFYFICGEIGSKDNNGLPDHILVCPAFGSDCIETYSRKVKDA